MQENVVQKIIKKIAKKEKRLNVFTGGFSKDTASLSAISDAD